MRSVVALAAQFGGAKLADGLYRLRGNALSVVVNTADDYEHLAREAHDELGTAEHQAPPAQPRFVDTVGVPPPLNALASLVAHHSHPRSSPRR